jgi:hypothetical protein
MALYKWFTGTGSSLRCWALINAPGINAVRRVGDISASFNAW